MSSIESEEIVVWLYHQLVSRFHMKIKPFRTKADLPWVSSILRQKKLHQPCAATAIKINCSLKSGRQSTHDIYPPLTLWLLASKFSTSFFFCVRKITVSVEYKEIIIHLTMSRRYSSLHVKAQLWKINYFSKSTSLLTILNELGRKTFFLIRNFFYKLVVIIGVNL